MLPYQYGAVDGLLRSKTCLAVLGQGLGIQKIILETLRRALAVGHSDGQHAQRLIFLLNTSQEEAELLAKRASEDPKWTGLRSCLSVIGPDFSVDDRAAAFSRGGAFIANARLLVPDMLSGRLVPGTIDGILVNHAHGVGELSADAFVLRLFRLSNTRGFIRAISDVPDAFSRVQVEKVMQRCFLNDMEVWPRIRKEVQETLKQGRQPEVVQIKLELPPQMLEIQRYILNIVQSTLGELKKDPNLDLSHLDLKDSISAAFDTDLRQVLDPAWQNLGPLARRLVNDLTGLRRLLKEMLRGDAVDFLRLLDSLCGKEAQSAPAWLHSPDAQAVLRLAKERVYEICKGPPLEPNGQMGQMGQMGQTGQTGQMPILQRKLEPHAKWAKILDAIDRTISHVAEAEQLCDIDALAVDEPAVESRRPVVDGSDSDLEIVGIKHIAKKQRTQKNANNGGVVEPRILIIAPDDRSRRQMSTFLHRGSEATLLDNLGSYFKERGARLRGDRGDRNDQMLNAQPQPREGVLLAKEAETVARELEEIRPDSGALGLRQLKDGRPCHPRIDVVVEETEGQLELRMEEIKPHAVIVFEPTLQAIRTVEVYNATVHNQTSFRNIKLEVEDVQDVEDAPDAPPPAQVAPVAPLYVYLLAFEDSIENYRYQQNLLTESKAVDAIIRFRQHMTWRVDLPTEVAPPESSRRGGGARAQVMKPQVVVDMREFRSTLPFMLHLKGLVVEPVTIPVGDYVLSRDVCVERKAIIDLVQSLNSGRLYQQAQNMCHHYSNPLLLIEFDPAKGFVLQSSYAIARREIEVGTKDLLGKLSLLVLHFPKLRLMWSPSPRFTADIFMKLKEGRYQPDARGAAQIDAEDPDGEELQGLGRVRSNSAAFEMLRKLPGVTPKNMHALARKAGTLAGILDLSLETLGEVMGNPNAEQLHNFLHANSLSNIPATQDRGQEMPEAALET